MCWRKLVRQKRLCKGRTFVGSRWVCGIKRRITRLVTWRESFQQTLLNAFFRSTFPKLGSFPFSSASWLHSPPKKTEKRQSYNCNPHEMNCLFTAKSCRPRPLWPPSSLNSNMLAQLLALTCARQFISKFFIGLSFPFDHRPTVMHGEKMKTETGRDSGGCVGYYIWLWIIYLSPRLCQSLHWETVLYSIWSRL